MYKLNMYTYTESTLQCNKISFKKFSPNKKELLYLSTIFKNRCCCYTMYCLIFSLLCIPLNIQYRFDLDLVIQ